MRKKADADRLAAEFGARFVPLLFDVTDEAAVKAAAGEVRAALAGETLAGLVNNAGVAIAGPFFHLPIADFRRQMEINVIGVVTVTQAFAPLLGADRALKGKPGRIVNISSVGGQVASPFVSPYNASKFAVEGLSEGLRRELLPFGIDVIVIAPGAVATPIWSKAEEVDITAYLQHALRRAAQAPAQLHAYPRRERLAAGTDRRGGAAGAHHGAAESALSGYAESTAGLDGTQAAETFHRSRGGPTARFVAGSLTGTQLPIEAIGSSRQA